MLETKYHVVLRIPSHRYTPVPCFTTELVVRMGTGRSCPGIPYFIPLSFLHFQPNEFSANPMYRFINCFSVEKFFPAWLLIFPLISSLLQWSENNSIALLERTQYFVQLIGKT